MARPKNPVTKMTERKFKAGKILLESGATYAEVAESIGVSTTCVYYIKVSETLEEYQNNIYKTSSSYRKKMAAIHAKEKEKEKEQKKVEPPVAPVKEEPAPQVVEHRQTVTIQATHYMMEEMKQMNEHLKFISNKLAFIVTELTGTKTE